MASVGGMIMEEKSASVRTEGNSSQNTSSYNTTQQGGRERGRVRGARGQREIVRKES